MGRMDRGSATPRDPWWAGSRPSARSTIPDPDGMHRGRTGRIGFAPCRRVIRAPAIADGACAVSGVADRPIVRAAAPSKGRDGQDAGQRRARDAVPTPRRTGIGGFIGAAPTAAGQTQARAEHPREGAVATPPAPAGGALPQLHDDRHVTIMALKAQAQVATRPRPGTAT